MFLESDTFCFLVPTILVKRRRQGAFRTARSSGGFGCCLNILYIYLHLCVVCLWGVSVCSEGAEKDVIIFNDQPSSCQCVFHIIPRGPPGGSGLPWACGGTVLDGASEQSSFPSWAASSCETPAVLPYEVLALLTLSSTAEGMVDTLLL